MISSILHCIDYDETFLYRGRCSDLLPLSTLNYSSIFIMIMNLTQKTSQTRDNKNCNGLTRSMIHYSICLNTFVYIQRQQT